jgi:uncharacterized protein YkwD
MPSQYDLRRAWIAAILTVVALGLAALSAAPAGAATLRQVELPCVEGVTCPKPPAPVCAGADAVPSADNLPRIRRATLCLLNEERAERGLSRLRANRPLRGVATRYARSMAVKNFFDHVSPSGSTFVERIKRSSYLKGARGYDVGENLAWGAGPLATPEAIVRAWMNSPGHRANILKGGFRDLGVGVAIGVPVAGGGAGATYVNVFGNRT